MNCNEIVKKAERHIRELYQEHLRPEFVYHNLEHVERVVKLSGQIADHYTLERMEVESVFVAAWFHDTGYLFSSNEHEEKSAKLAVSFLKQEKADNGLVKKVKECILATKIFKKSASLSAEIVSDADLFHLGTTDFWDTNKRMKEEMELRFGKEIPSWQWNEGALRLLIRHRFETDYCQALLQEGKQKNIDLLREWLMKNAI
jgi:predicted metal-dependent HD superfamily phosphohydrolase